MVLFSASIVKFLQEPLKISASSTALPRVERWNGSDPLNIVLIQLSNINNNSSEIEGLGLMTVYPEEEKFGVYIFPVDLDMPIPSRYGINPLYSVYRLGQLSDPPSGISLVEKTLKGHLGVSIDGYILVDSLGLKRIADFFGEDLSFENTDPLFALSNIPKWKDIFKLTRSYVRTDLSTPEIIKVLNFIRTVRSDKREVKVFSRGEFLDKVFLDSKRIGSYSETKIALEAKSILFLNGTDVPRLASRYARFASNIGCSVFSVGNSKKRYDFSMIIAEDLNSETLRRLSKVLQIKDVRIRNEHQLAEEPAILRADIAVILGFDKSNEF